MKRLWKLRYMTPAQQARRDIAPDIVDDCVSNGCVPMDDYAEAVYAELESAAVPFSTLWDSGDMPVLKYDDAFKKWRREQAEAIQTLTNERITCLLPWQILRYLSSNRKKSDRLYFSQGGLGSCFPYHQKVYTQNGAKTIRELLDDGKEFIVLSYSKRLGRVAAKRAYVYKTGVKPCLRITTDKGVFDSTTDHPFMLRTGEFVKAGELKVGMSLFHAATSVKTSNDAHQCVRVNLCHKGERRYFHQLIAEDILEWDCSEAIIHHRDGNALNNSPDNLELISRCQHASHHAALDTEKRLPSLQTPEYREKMRLNRERVMASTPLEKQEEWAFRSVREKVKNIGYRLINDGYSITTFDAWFDAYRNTRKWLKPYQKRECSERIAKYFGGYPQYLEALNADNHRIIAIEPIGDMEVANIGVYDPEPDDKRPWSEHNFMLCPRDGDNYGVNGIFVANCMGHGDAFAHHGATLIAIARGAPLIYCTINPVVTWSITKGGSIRGGQSVSEMAKGANLLGHYPEFLVGSNNLVVPNYKPHIEDAKQFQSGIMFLNFRGKELADEIIQTCAAGLGVAIGNGTAVSGSTRDANGIKIPILRGSWAHATSFIGYRIVNRVEYIGWVNSHGDRYPSSDEGEPADMCWMPRALVELFVATASGYGSPYIVFPESITEPDTSLHVATTIPFPEKWRFAA